MFSTKRIGEKKKDKILQELKDHASIWFRYWGENTQHYRFHTSFVNGHQWEDMDVQNFKAAHRPVITVNKISPLIRQALGEYRSNIYQIFLRKLGIEEDKDDSKMQMSVLNRLMPQQQQQQQQPPQGMQSGQQSNVATSISQLIKSNPVIPQDPKLKIYEGLLRQIAYCSDAEEVYFYAGKCALEGGYGAIQVLTEYDEGLTIRQRIRLDRKIDPTRCYWDRYARHISKIDGDYSGTITTLSKTEFERQYPNVEYPTNFTQSEGSYDVFWGDKDYVTIGEEYQKEYFKDKALFNAETGEIYYKSELDKDELKLIEKDKQFEEAECENYRIIYYKFTDDQILEKTECPSKYGCIIFVDGNSFYDKGIQRTQSFIKDAVDSQKALNLVASDIVLWLKLVKKNNWLVPIETVPAELLQWWNQTDNPPAYLPYKGEEAAKYGTKPEAIPSPSMPQDLILNFQRLENDIKVALGRYDANIGAPSNETSGIAVANRAIQGSNAITPYRENLRKAVIAVGRVILSAMPKVYDDERIVTITNRDGSTEEIPINKRVFNFKKLDYMLNIDMRKMGSWDIDVRAGANNALQKQQDIENIETLIKLDPTGQSYALLAPLLAEELDSPKAKQMAARLTFITPPSILAAEQGKEYAPPPDPSAQIQTQLAQLQLMQGQMALQKMQGEMQNEKIRAMSDQMESMAKMVQSQAAMKSVNLREKLEPQQLQVELLHGEADMQARNKELHADLIKSHLIHHAKMIDKATNIE